MRVTFFNSSLKRSRHSSPMRTTATRPCWNCAMIQRLDGWASMPCSKRSTKRRRSGERAGEGSIRFRFGQISALSVVVEAPFSRLVSAIRRRKSVVDIRRDQFLGKVDAMQDLVSALQSVRAAVEAGELDAHIETASAPLGEAFKRKAAKTGARAG
jgi:hypothetical protein